MSDSEEVAVELRLTEDQAEMLVNNLNKAIFDWEMVLSDDGDGDIMDEQAFEADRHIEEAERMLEEVAGEMEF